MNYIIRKASEEDFSSVFPLFKQLWPGKPLDEKALNLVFKRGILSTSDELFCAAIRGEIIGFCAYAVVNNLWQEGCISYMYAMVVDEKYRGQGIGKALINEAIADSRMKGLKRMELDSAFHREKAHLFYEKLGFEKRAYLFSYSL